jgi:hypothetical protein
MNRADEFLANAAKAEASAANARDPETKRQFQELAQQWRILAKAATARAWGVLGQLPPVTRDRSL